MEMTKEEIIEGNALIALFMGDISTVSDKVSFNKSCAIIDLKYHSSLDWLMPVIEKIRKSNFIIQIHASHDVFRCEISPSKQFIIDIEKPFPFFVLNSETLSLPMVIFQCINQFLISYNGIKYE